MILSHYTTQVRTICERYAGPGLSVNQTIQAAIPKVFDFDFPIFDEAYREVLCTKILRHYYTREIGEETVGLWKLRLETALNESMPYYNKLYESAKLEFNPLNDVDVTTTDNRTTVGEGTGTANGSGSSSGKATAYNLYSETPQGGVTGLDSQKYLTTATKDTNENSSTSKSESSSSSKSTTTDEYVRRVTGKAGTGSYAKMLMEYRKSLINVDAMVIESLADLFMLLW